MNRITTVEVCDATGDDSSTTVGRQNIQHTSLKNFTIYKNYST
ncbi:MAG TPA: hypothetical protein VKC90_07860 [Chitinophagaceae bacterium]|nr:hypothetical protein [Chitinophagaceae bacterium]